MLIYKHSLVILSIFFSGSVDIFAFMEHSHELGSVLDKMRRQPMGGKYVSACLRMFEEYKTSIFSGVRGEPEKILRRFTLQKRIVSMLFS